MSEEHTSTGCGCATSPADAGQMPSVTFSTFILSLASSALVQLGEVPDPNSGQTTQDLLMARHTIDVLHMLQEKTRNCLDAEEAQLLEGMLYELRMKYVVKSG